MNPPSRAIRPAVPRGPHVRARRGRTLRRAGGTLIAVLSLGAALEADRADAQAGLFTPELETDRPELPDFDPAPPTPRDILPPWPIPEAAAPSDPDTPPGDRAPAPRVRVREIAIEGNRAIPNEVLDAVVEPFLGEVLGVYELTRVRDALTRAYVERGYVTSGARLPAQDVSDGRLRVEIVEGSLETVEIVEAGGFRAPYLRARLEGEPGEIVDARRVEERLRRLQEDDRVERIEAALLPGSELGRARLRVEVDPRTPIRAAAEIGNHQPDEIREEHARLELEHVNWTGWGDRLRLETRLGLGIQDVGARYELPVTRHDTTLGLTGRFSQSQIQTDAFRNDNIESEFWSLGFFVRQPLLRRRALTADAFARLEWRESVSRLDGTPFSFVAGPVRGRSEIAALRFGGDLAYRTRAQALALRATASVGLPFAGATDNRGDPRGDVPDGRFFHVLLQGQWARRLERLADATLVLRGDAQLAIRPLLPLEQFALGGHATVRGYDENRLIRDNALIAGAELRLPLWRDGDATRWSLGPTADVGYGWNTDRPTRGATTLVSLGLATRLELIPGVRLEAAWARPLTDTDDDGDSSDPSRQADGLHLRVRAVF